MDFAKLNEAVHDGVERCADSRAPLQDLAAFVSDLRMGDRRQRWSDYEVFAIEMRVLRILSEVVSRS